MLKILSPVLASAVLLLGCNGNDPSGGSSLEIFLTASAPPPGSSSVVFVEEGAGGGDLVIVDLLVRDITDEFDGFNIEIMFDPLVAEASGYTSAGILDACAGGLTVLKCDNISSCSTPATNANSTGSIIISESIIGSTPPGCTASGLRKIGSLSFRAAGRGTSTLPFIPFNNDPISPQGSRFVRRSPAVTELPVEFFDSGALLEVTR